MNVFAWLWGTLLAAALSYTVWGYGKKYGALSGKSRLFRTVGMILLDLLLTTVVVYFCTDWNAMRYRIGTPSEQAAQLVALSQGLYFATWFLVSVLILGCAGLDSLENFSIYRKQRREALDELVAGAIAASVAKREATENAASRNGSHPA